MTNRATRVRLGLVGIASFLIVLITMQPSHSQGISGRPPGGISGGFSGRPGGIPPIGPPSMPGGGISGISGIGGRPGGISGIGGFPEPPGLGIRGVPGIPDPPGTGIRGGIGGGFSGAGIGGAGIGGGGGFGGLGPPRFETVWSCSRCGRELGRGDFPPAVNICPGCGARLIGGGIGSAPVQIPPIGGGIPNTPQPAMPMGLMGGPPQGVVPPNDFNNPPALAPPVMNTPSNLSVSPTPEVKTASRTWSIIGVTMGMLLLLGIGVTIAVMAWPKSKAKPEPRRRSRRSSRDRYDDDDDEDY